MIATWTKLLESSDWNLMNHIQLKYKMIQDSTTFQLYKQAVYCIIPNLTENSNQCSHYFHISRPNFFLHIPCYMTVFQNILLRSTIF